MIEQCFKEKFLFLCYSAWKRQWEKGRKVVDENMFKQFPHSKNKKNEWGGQGEVILWLVLC